MSERVVPLPAVASRAESPEPADRADDPANRHPSAAAATGLRGYRQPA